MKNYLSILALLMACIFNTQAQLPNEIPMAQPVKCYAKCFITDSLVVEEIRYPEFISAMLPIN